MTSSRLVLSLLLGLLALGRPASAQLVVKPVSEDEAKVLTVVLLQAVNARDHEAFDRCFDHGILADRALRGVPLAGEARRTARKGLVQNMSFGPEVMRALGPEGFYRLVGQRVVDGERRVLFALHGSRGLNYHDLVLCKGVDDIHRVCDFEIAAAGELMSTTLRRMALPFVAQLDAKALETVDAAELDFVRHHESRTKASRALMAGQAREALKHLDALPESLTKLKPVLLNRLMASAQLAREDSTATAAYRREVERFRAAFPGDAALDLMLLDYHVVSGRWAEHEACLRRLQERMLDDPFLDALRGDALREQGRHVEAKAAYSRVLQTLPGLGALYPVIIEHALSQEDHPWTLELMKRYWHNLGIWFDDFSTPVWLRFADTPQRREYDRFLRGERTQLAITEGLETSFVESVLPDDGGR
ncbi:MAG: hypothetical protein AAF533_14285 [Acidobacteriota bacterium]